MLKKSHPPCSKRPSDPSTGQHCLVSVEPLGGVHKECPLSVGRCPSPPQSTHTIPTPSSHTKSTRPEAWLHNRSSTSPGNGWGRGIPFLQYELLHMALSPETGCAQTFSSSGNRAPCSLTGTQSPIPLGSVLPA